MPVILYKYDIFDTHIQLTEYAPIRFFFFSTVLSVFVKVSFKENFLKKTHIH